MRKKILVVGANGMLGGSIFRYFSSNDAYDVIGTVRSENAKELLISQGFTNIISDVDVNNFENLNTVIIGYNPDYIFNCVGIIKQLDSSKVPVMTIEINSVLPHKLANTASSIDAKLIHFSTDCVFSGSVGGYNESVIPDATDLYGRSKLLGEVDYCGHITLRTSIIGHETNKGVSLVDWFLSQNGEVSGYKNAIFSGMPTCYLAQMIDKIILPNSNLTGLYHFSVDPIDKYTLLTLIKDIYQKEIFIKENLEFKIDRSLDSSLLKNITNFKPLPWPELIKKMHHEYISYFK
ncbi:dTDP-4-dehydrorhamnose reductase family protein [Yersinia wautersii]|uniref:dTDP-4-dehydrorhamnose reductase family protein n=1 Tax=Yersinia wautersii TaxID=1341643 RepID=UPI00041357C6|nr:SDR family oxidoreductase [Yersinia wautersii]